MKSESKIIKEADRDLCYKRMGNRKNVQLEDEPMVGLMEWVDLMEDYS